MKRTSDRNIGGHSNTPLEREGGNLLEAILTGGASDEGLPLIRSEEQVFDGVLAVGGQPLEERFPLWHHRLPAGLIVPSLQAPAIKEVGEVQRMLSVIVPSTDGPLGGLGDRKGVASKFSRRKFSKSQTKVVN